MKSIYFLLLFSFMTWSCQTPSDEAVNENPDIELLSEDHKEEWSGSEDHWRWEDGLIIGESTEDTPLDESSFLIWNRELEDFILKISFRISENGNSGIYYRSEIGPEGQDELLGYQADIDGKNEYTGIVYENFPGRGHKILAQRGQFVQVAENDTLEIHPMSLKNSSYKDIINENDWNEYLLIVQGSMIIQNLNGHLVSIVDDSFPDRVKKGKLGFQLHSGPPMKVEFRDAILRVLGEE